MLCEATRSRSDKSLLLFFFFFFLAACSHALSLSLVLSLRVEGKNGIKRYDITTEQTGFATY